MKTINGVGQAFYACVKRYEDWRLSPWSFFFSVLDAMIDERFDVRHALNVEA